MVVCAPVFAAVVHVTLPNDRVFVAVILPFAPFAVMLPLVV